MTDDIHFTHTESAMQAPLHYRACGLDNVYLRSGYVREEIGGEMTTAVKDADALHGAIADHLVLRRKVLTGKEIRFLRRFMDMTQADMGDLLGISDQTVARYEKEQTAFDGPADRLFRLCVLGKLNGDLDPMLIIKEIRQSDSSSTDDLNLDHTDHDWKVAA
jgi:DNA-binding transcriptional regulator YiaG